MKGHFKPHSEEAKRKISEAQKKRLNSIEVRKKLSESRLKGLAEGRIITWAKGKPSHLKGKKLLSPSKESIKKMVEKRKKDNSYIAWNKGLTKKDLRVLKYSESYKKYRKTLVLPRFDTSIELKIQNFLKQLNIEFLTHQYIKNIEHGYQCDIFIPLMNLIIECDGDFIHCNPLKYSENFIRFPNNKKIITAKEIWELDKVRTQELTNKGFKVLRLWESEIKPMDLAKFQEIVK